MLFSEGIDYDINDVFNNRERDDDHGGDPRRIAAATRANVAIYGVDSARPRRRHGRAIEVQDLPDRPDAQPGQHRSFQNETRARAGQPAGAGRPRPAASPLVNTNDFAGAFERIVDDNSSYYVLGYYSTNERRDGRFRKIEVKVRTSRATVRARKGYARRAAGPRPTRPTATTPPELRAAMRSPLPLSGLPAGAARGRVQGRRQRRARSCSRR